MVVRSDLWCVPVVVRTDHVELGVLGGQAGLHHVYNVVRVVYTETEIEKYLSSTER